MRILLYSNYEISSNVVLVLLYMCDMFCSVFKHVFDFKTCPNHQTIKDDGFW